jgi:hypothetical protein
VLEHAPAGREGAASAAMQLVNGLGNAVGSGVGGVLVATANVRTGSPRPGLILQDLLMLGVLAVAALAALRLGGRASG